LRKLIRRVEENIFNNEEDEGKAVSRSKIRAALTKGLEHLEELTLQDELSLVQTDFPRKKNPSTPSAARSPDIDQNTS
jgi:hypothetical protein